MQRLSIVESRAQLKTTLAQPFTSIVDVCKLFPRLANLGKVPPAFHMAFEVDSEDEIVRVMNSARESAIADGVLPSDEYLEVIGQLDQAEDAPCSVSVSYTRIQCRTLLAMSFFNGVPSKNTDPSNTGYEHWGEIAWNEVMGGFSDVGAARLACLLHYFKASSTEEWLEEAKKAPPIVFERVRLDAPRQWDTRLQLPKVHFSTTTTIEGFQDAGSHVDFANKNLQIHRIIASATQEEVLFSIRPELMLCIFMFSTLRSDEAAIFTGAAQYCAYRGYLDTFRFAGGIELEAHHAIPVIIGIDAINSPGSQYSLEMVNRDVTKAYVGFANSLKVARNDIIATGNWGCGAFGGNPALKFCQQLIAAAHAGSSTLMYSTFKDERLKGYLGKIYKLLQQKEVDSAGLYDLCIQYSSVWSRQYPFETYIIEKLSS